MKSLHALGGLGLLLLAACSSNLKENLQSDENLNRNVDVEWSNLINDREIKPQRFTVNVAQGGVFVTKTGSKIHVPKSAFVDAAGKPVAGEVEIEWNEYHSISDQLFSGINMLYDSAGVTLPFISGGMFSIDGSQNGTTVFIAQDKTIRVDLVSQSEQENFNFYNQDEQGTWRYIENSTSISPSETQSNVLAGSPAPVPEVKREGFIFDAQPRNLKDFDELAAREVLGWQTKTPLASRDHHRLRNERSVCELQRNDSTEYELNFIFKKDTMSYPVSPFFLEDAAAETKANRAVFDAKLQEVNLNLSNVARQNLIRSAEISSFGVYNWDVIATMTDKKPFYANFNCDNPMVSTETMNYALVCLTDNYQIRFQHGASYFYDASQKNTIIAIDGKGVIYFVIPSSFASFTGKVMSKSDYFSLTDSGYSLNTASDLDDVIRYLKTL